MVLGGPGKLLFSATWLSAGLGNFTLRRLLPAIRVLRPRSDYCVDVGGCAFGKMFRRGGAGLANTLAGGSAHKESDSKAPGHFAELHYEETSGAGFSIPFGKIKNTEKADNQKIIRLFTCQ